jgi:hypothetical protein
MEKVKLVKFAALTLRGKERGVGLQWSIRKGYPRITVYTGKYLKDDKTIDYDKIIIAPFDYTTMLMFLENFKSIIYHKDANVSSSIKCFNTKFVDNKRTDDVILQATATVGKLNGIIYLSVTADGKPVHKFELVPEGKWHKYFNGEEELVDKVMLSKQYAKAYYELLKTILLQEFFLDTKSEVEINSPIVDDNLIKDVTPEENKKITEDTLFE